MNTSKTKQLTLISILSAIAILLAITPLGFIPFGATRITFMHIPVILGAILGGAVVGGSVGLLFGIFSLFQNLTAPSSLLFFVFINPLVSVLPRVLIGILSGLFYHRLKKKLPLLLLLPLTGLFGTLVNTIGVLGMSYLLYASRITQTFHLPAGPFLLTIAGVHLPWEMAISAIFVLAIVKALPKHYFQ